MIAWRQGTALRDSVRRRRDGALDRPAHDARTASVLGVALGVCFLVCAVTGLLSHAIQHPPAWFSWPARPAGLYRVTQGLHVATGTAAIPLLLAKLWSVWPRLFLPLARDPIELVHRLTLVPLVGGAIFMLFTGYANVVRWYPWRFFFPRAHYWIAWVTVGALVVHVAARAGTARHSIARPPSSIRDDDTAHVSRRALLTWAFTTSLGITLVTAGQTAPWLRRIGRLVVEVDGTERLTFDLAALRAMPQRTAELPIACVEGWSQSATWRGVPLRDLLARAGVPAGRTVRIESLEQDGLYGRSEVEPTVWRDADTLLALDLNGEPLHLDHGYPVRLIAPNRPGVMQTKWVARVVA
jgi:DMSO/TMAO reductase YedYZ molybdopterin-dependent catalytic subunit